LHQGKGAEDFLDGLAQALATIDDHQQGPLGFQSTLPQIVQETAGHGAVLRGAIP
jgi:hypothetical protein